MLRDVFHQRDLVVFYVRIKCDAIFKEFFSIITNFEENEFKGIELFGIITKGQNS